MKIQIIYSTQMGTTQMVADQIKNGLTPAHTAEVVHASAVGVDDIQAAEVVIFAVPTYDDGQVEIGARPLIDALSHATGIMTPFAVVSPGDSAYPHYCQAGELITQACIQAGMKQLHDTLRIDNYMMNMQTANSMLQDWTSAVSTALETL